MPTVNYARPRRPRDGLFAGWYVTLGTLNVLVGGVQLALALILLGGSGVAWATGQVRGPWLLAWDGMVLPAFAAVCGGLVVVGSVAGFSRVPWARTAIRSGLAGSLLLGLYLSFELLTRTPAFRGPLASGLTNVVVGGTAYVAIAFWAYSNIRADFYFRRPTGPGPVPPRVTPSPSGGPAASPTLRLPPAGSFEVFGTDTGTGLPVRLLSRAATEPLARKSAVAQGLLPDTIQVRPLPDTDAADGRPESAPGPIDRPVGPGTNHAGV